MSWHQATFLPVTEGELGAAGQMLLQRIINMHKRHIAGPGQLEQLLLAMGVDIAKVADQKYRAARLGDAPAIGEHTCQGLWGLLLDRAVRPTAELARVASPLQPG